MHAAKARNYKCHGALTFSSWIWVHILTSRLPLSARYLCVECASTSHVCKELHQSSQTQASNANQRLLYSQVTQRRTPSRNVLQLPCGWLSSSSWPSFRGTWHTWAQLWFEKLLICHLFCCECALLFCGLSWGVGKSFGGGALLEGVGHYRSGFEDPSLVPFLAWALFLLPASKRSEGPAVHAHGMSSTMASLPPWTDPSQTVSQINPPSFQLHEWGMLFSLLWERN